MQPATSFISERVAEIFGSNFTVRKAFSSDKYEIVHGGKTCLDFEFMDEDPTVDEQMPFIKHDNVSKPRILKVSSVFKCQGDERKGASLMRLIDRLAESIPFVEYITLMDASNIMICDISISLAQLKILTTGQSWYNHFGYKTKWHDANVAHNEVIINTPVDDVMRKRLMCKNFIETIGKKLFPELSTTMTVREYVQAVLDSVRPFPEKCTPDQREKASFLHTLIYQVGWMNDLQYINWNLIKRVERGPMSMALMASSASSAQGHGGNKRNKRSRTRSNKKRKRSRSRSTKRKRRTRSTKKRF
jgi:hypothetical protein